MLVAVAVIVLVSARPNLAETPGKTLNASTHTARQLPVLPQTLPSWLFNTKTNHIARKRGVYNDAIYQIRPLALDMNGVAVGHAMAYEDLVTGKAHQLETQTYARIWRVLKNPPPFMPDEAALSPTFGRLHFNLDGEWKSEGERRFVPGAILGFSKPLGYPTRFNRTGLLEIGWRKSETRGADSTISLGAEIRQQISPRGF